MAKARIKTPSGTEITIEGDPAEVAKIISQMNQAPVAATSRKQSPEKERKRELKKEQTASDLIAALKEERFFDKPRALVEVAARLENEGRLYPVTTLSGVMLSLVQKKILTRIKREGLWVYGKR
jgi:hypothetical protein